MLDDADRPLSVAMRHPPNPAASRLLESLGVAWRVDPAAPRCERPCGNSRCARTAAELREIARRISDETRRQGLPRIREHVEREIEQGIRVVRDPRDVSLNERSHLRAATGGGSQPVETPLGLVWPDRECKIDGCENRANARYDRGLLAGRCWEIHVEEARGRYRDIGRRTASGRSSRTLPRPERVEAPAPREIALRDDPPDRQDVPGPDFVELAVEIHEATAELQAAQQRYETARLAIVAHPLFVELAQTLARPEAIE